MKIHNLDIIIMKTSYSKINVFRKVFLTNNSCWAVFELYTLRRTRVYKKACDLQYILHLSIIISSNDIDISMKKYNEENNINVLRYPWVKSILIDLHKIFISFKSYTLIIRIYTTLYRYLEYFDYAPFGFD